MIGGLGPLPQGTIAGLVQQLGFGLVTAAVGSIAQPSREAQSRAPSSQPNERDLAEMEADEEEFWADQGAEFHSDAQEDACDGAILAGGSTSLLPQKASCDTLELLHTAAQASDEACAFPQAVHGEVDTCFAAAFGRKP